MLLEEGFRVTSTDASDRMLKYALKTRWNRRKEPAFDDWVIEEGNWLTLPDDIVKPPGGTWVLNVPQFLVNSIITFTVSMLFNPRMPKVLLANDITDSLSKWSEFSVSEDRLDTVDQYVYLTLCVYT